MNLSMSLVPACRMALICSVCQSEIDPADKTEVEQALFGSVRYAVCCCCKREVRDHDDRNYRARFRRWLKKQAKAKPEANTEAKAD